MPLQGLLCLAASVEMSLDVFQQLECLRQIFAVKVLWEEQGQLDGVQIHRLHPDNATHRQYVQLTNAADTNNHLPGL
jgi:hypothetical protein